MSLIYLASPYSDPDPGVRQARFEATCRAAAVLMRAGEAVFAPVCHSHPIALHGGLHATAFDFWMRADRPLLEACTEVMVLRLPGWEQSRGIAEELRIAAERGIPETYIEPDE